MNLAGNRGLSHADLPLEQHGDGGAGELTGTIEGFMHGRATGNDATVRADCRLVAEARLLLDDRDLGTVHDTVPLTPKNAC